MKKMCWRSWARTPPERLLRRRGSAFSAGLTIALILLSTAAFTQTLTPKMALTGDGDPVRAYAKTNTLGVSQIYVQEWNGGYGDIATQQGQWLRLTNSWVELEGTVAGEGVSSSTNNSVSPSVAVDGSTVYVAWTEQISAPNQPNHIFVKKYNGAEWVELGGSASGNGVSGNSTNDAGMAVIRIIGGKPTVLWRQTKLDGGTIYRMYLKQWNGTQWVQLAGSASGTGIPGATLATQPDMVDLNGYPAVTWQELSNLLIRNRYFNGAAWISLPDAGNGPYLTSPDLDEYNGTLYLSWVQYPVYSYPDCMRKQVFAARYTGTWTALGSSMTACEGLSVSTNSARDPGSSSISVNFRGEVVAAWQGGTNGHTAVQAKKWAGGSWYGIGTPNSAGYNGIETNAALRVNPQVDHYGGEPLITFEASGSVQTYIRVGDRTAPAFDGLKTATGTNTGVLLTWNQAIDDVTASSNIAYHVYRTTASVPCSSTNPCVVEDVFDTGTLVVITNGATSYLVTGLANGRYCFGVRAADAGGRLDNNTEVRSAGTFSGVGDTDSDCLDDTVEVAIGTEPCNIDTDGDSMWDGWEWRYSTNNALHPSASNSNYPALNPLDNGAINIKTGVAGDPDQFGSSDIDGDGLTNYEEFNWWFTNGAVCLPAAIGTATLDPTNPDTDGDGAWDGWEVYNGLNPLSAADGSLDPDGDGVANSNEFKYGGNPHSGDSDSDGIGDGAEIAAGTHPGLADTDEDGLDDGFEVNFYGSNPLRADSMTNTYVSDGCAYQLGWADRATATLYDYHVRENFEGASWTNWLHYPVNLFQPFDIWHRTVTDPDPKDTNTPLEVHLLHDRTTNHAFRAAKDPSGMNLNADYNLGALIQCAVQPPAFNPTNAATLFVEWNEFYETEPFNDFLTVQARGGNNPGWIPVSSVRSGLSTNWIHRAADLSAFAGMSNVEVRFVFTVQNTINNHLMGWWVDDVVVYSGVKISGWVRDVNGRPLTGAKVLAVGMGGVTNVINGHRYVLPGKVMGEGLTGADGRYAIVGLPDDIGGYRMGLPQGHYYVKASQPEHKAEFFNGTLFTGVYAFGSGILTNVGVFSRESVEAKGWIDATNANTVTTNTHFELERGLSRSFLGVGFERTQTMPVYLDNFGTHLARVWNGVASTTTVNFTTYNTRSVDTLFNNYPDWSTNAVLPNLLADMSPGSHFVQGGAVMTYPVPEVVTREGELTIVDISTNHAPGNIQVTAANGGSYPILLNGQATGVNTPAKLTVGAGVHLVSLSGGKYPIKRVEVVGAAKPTAATFSTAELTQTGNARIQAIDINGNSITGASIFVNGSVIDASYVAGGATTTTPTTLVNLNVGEHYVTLAKSGYRGSQIRSITVTAGVGTTNSFILYQSDEEYDGVGDAREVLGYGNIFLYAGGDDPDGDGLSNDIEDDLFRLYGVNANPFEPDSDSDGETDGAEAGFDGLTNLYALTTLYTNAVQGSTTVEALFVGRFLRGIDNFGSGNVTASIDCDRFQANAVGHYVDLNHMEEPARTVFQGVPQFVDSVAVSMGHAAGTQVYADTRPDVTDTDGDGMWDGFEIKYQGSPSNRVLDAIECNDPEIDSDNDGVSNGAEFRGKDGIANTNDFTSPIDADTDDDQLPDGWEYDYSLDPRNPVDAFSDGDGDGLVNLGEYYGGANPTLRDTDADYLDDGKEVIVWGTDPQDVDTDNDSLLDGQEVADKNMDGIEDGGFFTGLVPGGDFDGDGFKDGPTDWDTDGDGMPDGFEVVDAFGNIRPVALNPYDPTDSDEDADGDGLSNYDEYLVRDALTGHSPLEFDLLYHIIWNMEQWPVWDYSTDPFNADSDGDGMPDGYEVQDGLHPVDPVPVGDDVLVRYNDLGPDGDVDRDGLWNIREYNIRFRLDPNADSNSVNSVSTHPWRPDTDFDGLVDGEEHHALFSHPILQDTDGDRLMDGTNLSNTYGEVDSSLHTDYELVVTNITWDQALVAAVKPHPKNPTIFGHLAVIGEGVESYEVTRLIQQAGVTNVAVGGAYLSDGTFFWVNGEPYTYRRYIGNDPAATDANRLALDGNGYWKAIVSNDVIDALLIEYSDISVNTNHFDSSTNDLWRLVYPTLDVHDLPYWEKVALDPASLIPPPRWGHAQEYVPVFEKKVRKIDGFPYEDGRNEYTGPEGTVLLDNRKLVVIGGRDGIDKYRDVWEYWVQSNSWTRSAVDLGGMSINSFNAYQAHSGVSEFDAVLLLQHNDQGCRNLDPGSPWDANRSDLTWGLPKARPYSSGGYLSRSYDYIFIQSGWNDRNQYLYPEPIPSIYYKSTDDPSAIIEESRFDLDEDVWQSIEGLEFKDTNGATTVSAATNLYGYVDDGKIPFGRYEDTLVTSVVENGTTVGTNTFFRTNVATAIRFNEFPFRGTCETIYKAEYIFWIDSAPAADLDLTLKFEFKKFNDDFGTQGESAPYDNDHGLLASTRELPLTRLTFSHTNSSPVDFTITNGATGLYTVDVTTAVSDIINAQSFESRSVGIVITNRSATGFALISQDSHKMHIEYIPVYKQAAEWHDETTVQTEQGEVPSKRKSIAMAYNHLNDRIVIFGGMNGKQVFDETYEGEPRWAGADDRKTPTMVSWTRMTTEQVPPARWGHSLVFDANNNRMILFGGFDDNHKALNDVWAYESAGTVSTVQTNDSGQGDGSVIITTNTISTPATWTQLTAFQDSQRPAPRGGAAVVYFGGWYYDRGDTSYTAQDEGTIVVFGGTDGKRYFNDTWLLDFSFANRTIDTTNSMRWILVDPGGQHSAVPSPRAFAGFSYAQNGDGAGSDLGIYENRVPLNGGDAVAFLFGGRTGVLPTNKDTDGDMVDDGVEYELGGPAAGRDPRVNALVSPNATETIPFVYNRIGTWPGDDLVGTPPRAPIADFEVLSYNDRVHGDRMLNFKGYTVPWQGYPLETTLTNVTWTIGDESFGFPYEDPHTNRIIYITGVDAFYADWYYLWFHRHGVGDPEDPKDEWELGTPDPSEMTSEKAPPWAHSGRWCYGTDLNGTYANSARMELYSPLIDLDIPSANSTDPANSNSWHLVFHEWLNLADVNDIVRIEVIRPKTPADIYTRSEGQNPVLTVLPNRNSAYNTSNDWRRVVVPLDIVGNASNVYFRFTLLSDSEGVAGGWYIDDVAIMQGAELSGSFTNLGGTSVVVSLIGTNYNGHIYSNTVTDANGNWGFGLLPLGDYQVGSIATLVQGISITPGSWEPMLGGTNLVAISVGGPGVTIPKVINWPAVPGALYRVEAADDLGPWYTMAYVVASSSTQTYTDYGPYPTTRSYRVWAVPAP
ncbi:MAG: hypothetical protein KJ626_13255 [Verrucomicrobia bacterium]|nr:hypothetical protein [Verrucomicrobiota bacterium]